MKAKADISKHAATIQKDALIDCSENATLLNENLHLIQPVLDKITRHLPNFIEREDLYSTGLIGLIEALKRYDEDKKETFPAYAKLRIRGAILDELRRMDCMPRTSRAKARMMDQTVQDMEQHLGRTPTDEELRKEMGLNRSDFHRMQRQVRPVVMVPLDKASTDENGKDEPDLHEAIMDENQDPSWMLAENEEHKDWLVDAIDYLPNRQKKLLAMLYYENMRLEEVAEIFGVTSARVCQIRTQAINNLRKFMKPMLGEA